MSCVRWFSDAETHYLYSVVRITPGWLIDRSFTSSVGNTFTFDAAEDTVAIRFNNETWMGAQSTLLVTVVYQVPGTN